MGLHLWKSIAKLEVEQTMEECTDYSTPQSTSLKGCTEYQSSICDNSHKSTAHKGHQENKGFQPIGKKGPTGKKISSRHRIAIRHSSETQRPDSSHSEPAHNENDDSTSISSPSYCTTPTSQHDSTSDTTSPARHRQQFASHEFFLHAGGKKMRDESKAHIKKTSPEI